MVENQRPVEELITLADLADDFGWELENVLRGAKAAGYHVSLVSVDGERVHAIALRDAQRWRSAIIQERAARWRAEARTPHMAADTAMDVIYNFLGNEPDTEAALEFIEEAYANMISILKE